jgi:hypothetical protein
MMVELRSDALVFTFPDVHRDAELRIDFQRTLRIPDDGRKYSLPPGLGRFPLRHVDDFAERIPTSWRTRGGVMLPMYQSEALWLHFTSPKGYPFAVKVATGKINAVTGASWSDGLHRDPQDYMSVPDQPWLDGYCVEKGVIRQFVAMPLGAGYSAEEQITGEAEHGGIQIVVYPVKAKVWERMRRPIAVRASMYLGNQVLLESDTPSAHYDMGLAPGGMMDQAIYDDSLEFTDWDLGHRGRCFVHLANSLVWQSVTGTQPPSPPLTAEAYTRAGMPWFDYYDADRGALEGAGALAKMKSVADLGGDRSDVPLPENESVDPANVVKLGPKANRYEVREGTF